MFVRVEGSPGGDVSDFGDSAAHRRSLRDADNIRELLNSAKEESELTMCSDVDRNDKSRVCVPGTVQVIGRRLIERYAGVFHTVDHVEGVLAPGFDSLDAFLTHMWAVTVIGAPKKAAAQAIENLEKNARSWYGGALGMLALNGDMNTGILIRTVHLKDGEARYSAGATLLYDSVPENEEQETRLKATGFFRALAPPAVKADAPEAFEAPGAGVRMMLVDNDDCFIHTLANYARQTGAEVVTYRAGFPLSLIDEVDPSLILISPGPGRPSDFGVPDLVRHAAQRGVPVFGVCLGLQGVVEAFGGELGVLEYPMHGKPSVVAHRNVGIFEGLPAAIQGGAVSLVVCAEGLFSGGARGDCGDRGRGDHGGAAPRVADRGGAVSSGVDAEHLWAGAAAHCNIHKAHPPHCPWCSIGMGGFASVYVAILAAQFVALRLTGAFSWPVRLLAVLAAFPAAAGVLAIVIGWQQGYWNQ
jgi:anthranilate synthase